MVKKLKTSTAAKNAGLASRLEDSARKLWETGATIYSTVQATRDETVGRVNREVRTLRNTAEKRVKRTVGEVRQRANATRGQIEQRVQRSMTVPLEFLGVPTQKDIDRLSRRVAELTTAVKRLAADKAGKAATAA